MKQRYKPYVMLLPATLVLMGVFAMGLLQGLLQSVGYFPVVGLREITLKYYREVLTDPGFLESLSFSLYTSLVSSVLAVIFGVLLAYAMAESKNKRRLEQVLYRLPIVVPHTVAALLVYNFLSQTGIVPRVFSSLGWISDPSQFPSMLFDKNGAGIILAYVWKEIPFVALVAYTVLANISGSLADVASNLGASRLQTFRYVLFPLMMPSVASAFIIVFAFSFGAFEVPYLLGPTTPKALPVKAYVAYGATDLTQRPYAMVINTVLAFVSFAMIWLYQNSVKLLSRTR